MGLTAERARELLAYDPVTGALVWRVRSLEHFLASERRTREHACAAWNAKNADKPAGTPSHGYLRVNIGRQSFPAHRLAWLIMHGEWPIMDIDHINMDRSDNRWSNLRAATRSQNKANQRRRSLNTSGWAGVTWDKERGKWLAQIKVDYRTHFIGRFDCPAAAAFAYQIEADKAFGDFARTS